MSWRVILCLPVCLLALVGCARERLDQDPVYLKDSDIISETHNAVDALLSSRRSNIHPGDGVVVASIVDVNNVRATTAFGRTVSELICSRLTQRGYAVTETRTRADSINIDRSGQFVLSQDIKDLLENYNVRGLMAGTYSVAHDRVYITLRFIDAKAYLQNIASDGLPAEGAQYNVAIGGIDYPLWLGPRTADLLGIEAARLPDVAQLPYFPRIHAEMWGRTTSHDGR